MATVPSSPSSSKRVRDQIREHLIPANTVLGFSLALVSLADVMLPRLLPVALGLRNVAFAVALLLVIAAFWPRPIDRLFERLGWVRPATDEGGAPVATRRLWIRRLLVPAAIVAVALTASLAQADTGGVVATQFPSVRTLQEQLLGLRGEVRAIGDGVARANQSLDQIQAREQALQQQMAQAPVSMGLLDLQAIGGAAERGGAWSVRLAVYLNAPGQDVAQLQLWFAHGSTAEERRVENLAPSLGGGTTPTAVQLTLSLPAGTRWVSACLLPPPGADSARRALVQRWRVQPGAGAPLLQTEGAPALRAIDDAACVAA